MDWLSDLAGGWESAVDLPGAGDVRGHAGFEMPGEILTQRATVPVPEAPGSYCLVVTADDGCYTQDCFDCRGGDGGTIEGEWLKS